MNWTKEETGMFLHSNHPHNRHLQKIVCLDTAELSQRPDNLDAALERLHLNCRATTLALAAALEAKDPETRHHSERVVAYCLCLGRALKLSVSETVTLEQGALLHDIGKIGVRDAVLLKRGALTDEEWEHMRRHVEFGARILSGIDFLKGASEIVVQHHERFDGSGYPDGIAGESICLGARIFAVADAVDAITSNRPYRKARPFEHAAEELTRGSGAQFDPAVVRAFVELPFDTWRETRYAASERARHSPQRAYNHLH
jgi:putative nucleotidyltransferase with HDIG domain